jgi:hypothetical protein
MIEHEQHSYPAQAPFFLVMCRLFALYSVLRGVQFFSLEHFVGYDLVFYSVVQGGILHIIIGVLLWSLAPVFAAKVCQIEAKNVRIPSVVPWDFVAYAFFCAHFWLTWVPDWSSYFFHSLNADAVGRNWHESDGLKILVTSLLTGYFLLNRKLGLLIGFIGQFRRMEKSK